MSTLPDCSEDLPFDFCVLKFQNGNQQTSNNEHELEQHPLSEKKLAAASHLPLKCYKMSLITHANLHTYREEILGNLVTV